MGLAVEGVETVLALAGVLAAARVTPNDGTDAIGAAPCKTEVGNTDCPAVEEDNAFLAVVSFKDVMGVALETVPDELMIVGTVVNGVLRTSVDVTGQFKLTVALMSLTAALLDMACDEVDTTGGIGGTGRFPAGPADGAAAVDVGLL